MSAGKGGAAPAVSPDRVRLYLQEAAEKREKAQKAREDATDELRYWLREAQKVDGLSMSEAARLGGVSRFTAYELLKD